MRWYNIKYKSRFIVKFPWNGQTFEWKRIVGVQIGSWFIGAVKGTRIEEPKL